MSKTNKSNVYRMTGLGILTAIIVVLQVITTYFPTKPFAVTLALIPIVIGAAIFGPKAGAYLGGVFSVVVIIMCVIGADVGGAMVWNANPFLCVLVCMLKGVAAGFVSGLLFRLVAKKNLITGTAVAAVVSPIVNTGIFYIGMLLFFREVLALWSGGSNVLFFALSAMTSVNFLVELGVNIIVTPIIVAILRAIKKDNLIYSN